MVSFSDRRDVFTIKGWEKHEEERRKVAEREDRKTELSDEPEEETVLPRTVLIFLRGPSVKLQLKVMQASFFSSHRR